MGCGFDFNRNFADSDTKDFSLIGFADVEGTTIGGAGGRVVEAFNYDQLVGFAADTDALIIRIASEIPLDEVVDVASNKTVEGILDSGRVTGNGFKLNGAKNVIIRNLTFSGAAEDALSIENSDHVWVDHNDFSNAGDELVDVKTGSSFVTVSWNHFHAQNKVCLIGASDDDGTTDQGRLKVTLHHNWFDGTTQYHPRCRFGEIHVFNNYFDNLGSDGYGIASTTLAKVLSESNSFVNVNRPFSLEEGTSTTAGQLASLNDLFENCGETVTAGESFAPTDYYEYKADAAASIAGLVQNYSGVGVLEGTD
jgi:pectate lyase